MYRSHGLDQFLADLRSTYILRRPNSSRLAEAAARVFPGGNTRSVLHAEPFPFRVASASGAELVDIDGNHYLDLLGNFSAGLFGSNPEFVREALEEPFNDGWGYGALNKPEAEFARLVCERFPSIDQVRFTNSGSEANLMAISAARVFTKRESILVFEGAYHGAVLSFSAVGRRINPPYDWIVCDYNSLQSVATAFRDRGSEIAAVLVEPMLGAGGCIRGTPTFLTGLAELCASHETLLVFDEVMTSRLSNSGAQGLLGVSPDMTTLGKYIAGGLTIGAFGGSQEIMRTFDVRSDGAVYHGGTFNNNMLSMTAGVAALQIGLGPDTLETLNTRGEKLRERLNEVFAASGVAMYASGWGSILTIHSTRGPVETYAELSGADTRVSDALFLFLANEGFYIAPRGYLALSLEVTDSQLDGFISAVESFVTHLVPE